MIRYDTEKLKAIPIRRVVEELGGEVKREGNTYRTLCPWHSDTNPSLVLYEGNGNRCKCFACGASHGVIDLVMQKEGWPFTDACRWLSERFGVDALEVDDDSQNEARSQSGRKAVKKKRTIEDIIRQDRQNMEQRRKLAAGGKEPTYIDLDYVLGYMSSENSFCKCLKRLFPADRVEAFTRLYMLGCYGNLGNADDVLFPCIDGDLRVHDIKVQHYDCNVGSEHFFHCDRKHIFWLGEIRRKRGCYGADATFDHTCLFGEHLLRANPDMVVALVESPKNAVVGACRYPDLLWVATGNKTNLSRRSLSCLQNRRVLVLPDLDAAPEWERELARMKDIATFCFSPIIGSELPALGEKSDVADWIVGEGGGSRDEGGSYTNSLRLRLIS